MAMNKETSVQTKQRYAADYLLLFLSVASVAVTFVIAQFETSGDMVRSYAYLALFVELLLFYYFSRRFIDKNGGKTRFGLVPVMAIELFFAFVAGISLFYIVTALSALLELLYIGLGVSAAGGGGVAALDGWRFLAGILLVVVIPAFSEEIFFRGALLHAYVPMGKWKAILHSSLVFALIHVSPLSMPLLLLLGMAFSYAALRAGSVYVSAAMHMGYNFMVLLYSFMAAQINAAGAQAVQSITLQDILPGVLQFLFLGAVLCILSVRGLLRFASRRQNAVNEAARQLYKAVQEAVQNKLSKAMREKLMHDPADQEENEQAPHAVQADEKDDHARYTSKDKLQKRGAQLAWLAAYVFLTGLNILAILQIV